MQGMRAKILKKHRFHRLKKGLTLIEIMIVIALIAGMMTIAAYSMGVLGQGDVRTEALRFSSSIRYTFNMAASSGETLQMKLDLENNAIEVDKLDLHGALSRGELGGTTMRSKDEDHTRRNKRATKLDDEDLKFGRVSRSKVEESFISGDDAKLAEGVYFIGLMTSHHEEIQTDGIGTINFFPNGFVERSVVFLGDEVAAKGEEGGIIYTVSIQPLTGQSSVTPGRMEIGAAFFEEEQDD